MRPTAATGLLALAAALLAGTVPARAAEPVKIGIATPLSGAAATYGAESKQGAELAADEINAGPGILGGRKVQLVFEDDKGSPQGGVAAVQKLMSVDRVKAITGGSNSSVVLAESSITRNRILHVNAAAQADAITEAGSPYLFQINNTVSTNSREFNRYITETLKPKTVAYMGENTEFNKTVLENLRASLKAAGIELVEAATYDADTNDFTSILTRLKARNPDLLYVADAYPARAAQLWKQVRQLGGFPKEVMSPGVIVPGMIKPADGAMEGVVTGEIFMPGTGEPRAAAFVEAFRRKYGVDPGKGPLVIYEAVKVIAGAMDKAGTDSDPAAIAKAIRGGTWDTPRGELTFDAKGRAVAPFFYIQAVKDGALAQIARVKGD